MIRIAQIIDLESVTKLANSLWENHSFEELKDEMSKVILKDDAMIALAFENNIPIAFSQCQLRNDYVEGTESSPVGYLEGIYVQENYRHKGIAKKLLDYCEEWAKEKNCNEFASDCELYNINSYHFHLAVGFIEANRIIHFNKRL